MTRLWPKIGLPPHARDLDNEVGGTRGVVVDRDEAVLRPAALVDGEAGHGQAKRLEVSGRPLHDADVERAPRVCIASMPSRCRPGRSPGRWMSCSPERVPPGNSMILTTSRKDGNPPRRRASGQSGEPDTI